MLRCDENKIFIWQKRANLYESKGKSLNDVTVVNIWVWSLLFEIAQDTKQFDWEYFWLENDQLSLTILLTKKFKYSVLSCANLTGSNSIS